MKEMKVRKSQLHNRSQNKKNLLTMKLIFSKKSTKKMRLNFQAKIKTRTSMIILNLILKQRLKKLLRTPLLLMKLFTHQTTQFHNPLLRMMIYSTPKMRKMGHHRL
jgi:hypothetical protein